MNQEVEYSQRLDDTSTRREDHGCKFDICLELVVRCVAKIKIELWVIGDRRSMIEDRRSYSTNTGLLRTWYQGTGNQNCIRLFSWWYQLPFIRVAEKHFQQLVHWNIPTAVYSSDNREERSTQLTCNTRRTGTWYPLPLYVIAIPNIKETHPAILEWLRGGYRYYHVHESSILSSYISSYIIYINYR